MTTSKVQFPGHFGAIPRPKITPSIWNHYVMRHSSPSYPVQFVAQFRAIDGAIGPFKARRSHG